MAIPKGLLSELIRERIIRVDETTFDPDRAGDPTYDGVPRIRTESIANLVNRILTWWWEDRKITKKKKIERQLIALTSEICSLKTELRIFKSVISYQPKGITFELAEEIDIREEIAV